MEAISGDNDKSPHVKGKNLPPSVFKAIGEPGAEHKKAAAINTSGLPESGGMGSNTGNRGTMLIYVINDYGTACPGYSYTVPIGSIEATGDAIGWSENGSGSITNGISSLTPTYTSTSADAGQDVVLTLTVLSQEPGAAPIGYSFSAGDGGQGGTYGPWAGGGGAGGVIVRGLDGEIIAPLENATQGDGSNGGLYGLGGSGFGAGGGGCGTWWSMYTSGGRGANGFAYLFNEFEEFFTQVDAEYIVKATGTLHVLVMGGGGSGGGGFGTNTTIRAGGGAGYMYIYDMPVIAGQHIYCTIGKGGQGYPYGGYNGEPSQVMLETGDYIWVNGGSSGASSVYGGYGSSGGGSCTYGAGVASNGYSGGLAATGVNSIGAVAFNQYITANYGDRANFYVHFDITPVSGSLTKTPDVLSVCEGTNVSAILTAGSGGNGIDELKYRFVDGDGYSAWTDYTSGTEIPTNGKTLVEIMTRRNSDNCPPSFPNVVSWVINQTPTAVSVSGGGNFCAEAVLTATGGEGETIYWQGATSGGTSTSTNTTTQTVTASGTYYFRAMQNGCWGEEGSASVIITPLPDAPTEVTASPAFICNSESTSLSATSTGNSIAWYTEATGGESLGSSLSGADFSVSPTSTTTYYAEAVLSNNLLGNITQPEGDVGNWTLGYVFTPDDDLTIYGFRRYFGSKMSIWSMAGDLIYSQAVTGTDGEWTENSIPNPIKLTGGTSYVISAYTNAQNYYYGWADAPLVTPYGAISGEREINGDSFPVNDGYYTVTFPLWFVDLVTSPYPCVSETRTPVTVSVEGAAVVGTLAKSPDAANICEGTSVSAILTPGSGGNGTDGLEYRIQSDDGNGSTEWSDWATYTSGTDIPTVDLTAVEIRTRRIATYCSSSDYATISWIVEETPISGTLTKSPDADTICEGTSVAAVFTSGAGGNGVDELEYRTRIISDYSDGPTGWSAWAVYTSGAVIPTDELSAVQIRTRRRTNNCTYSDYTTVSWIVNQLPTAVSVSGSGTFCAEAVVTATGGEGGTIYWQGEVSGGIDTTHAITTQTVTENGTYYFRSRSNEGCWGEEGNAVVIITPLLDAPTEVTASPAFTCSSESTSLNATSAGNSIVWYTEATGGESIGSSFSGADFSVAPSSTTTYYAEAVLSNNLLGNITQPEGYTGNWTMGYIFTPSNDLTIYGFRRYFGSKMSIWSMSGVLIYSQAVNGTDGEWTDNTIPNPIELTGGTSYIITAYTNNQNYYYNWADPAFETPYGIISGQRYVAGDGFPTIDIYYPGNFPLWLVDLVTSPQVCASETRTPVTVTVEDAAVVGTLTKTPDATNICEGTSVSAILTPGSGGNGTDELEYRTQSVGGYGYGFSDWSDWTAYTSGTDISTVDLTAVEIRTRRTATYCSNSDYVTVSWIVEETPISGTLTKSSDADTICEGTSVAAVLTSGTGGNGVDELEYRTRIISDYSDGPTGWSEWATYVSGAVIPTDEMSAVEIRTRRLSDYCTNADYTTVNWIVNELPSVVTVAGSGAFCAEAVLAATGGEGGTIYWQGAISGGTDTTDVSTTQTVTESGIYYFRSRSAEGCWGEEGSAVVRITPLPDAPTEVTASPDFICNSENVSLNATSTGNSIAWYTEATGGETIGSSNSGADFSVAPSATTTYYAEAVTINNLLGDVSHDMEFSGHWTLGYIFTPDDDLIIYGFRRYFGSKISIWTMEGNLVYSQAVTGTDGTWTENSIATPIQLTGGVSYVITAFTNSQPYYMIQNYGPISTPCGVIRGEREISTDAFPSNGYDSGGSFPLWLVDLVTSPNACVSETRTPVTVTVEDIAVAGTLTKTPDVMNICEGTPVSALLSPGSGGNGIDELEYRFASIAGTSEWSDWTVYTSGDDISTYGVSAVEVRTIRTATYCTSSDYVTVNWNVEKTPAAGNLIKSPDVEAVCIGVPVSATISGGVGGNGINEVEFRTQSGSTWSDWTPYVEGENIATTDKTGVEIRTRRLATYCSDSEYNTISWNVEATPIAGTLIRIPDISNVCEGSTIYAYFTPGTGGNGTDEVEYRTKSGNDWSEWMSYIYGGNINTIGVSAVEVRNRRMASYCSNSEYNIVSWNIEATPIAGSLTKSPDVFAICEGTPVAASLSSGFGGNGSDELEYRTQTGADWSDWQLYVSGENIPTIGRQAVEVRTRRMAAYCSHSDYNTVNWLIETTPSVGALTKLPDSPIVCEGLSVSALLTSGTGGNGIDELEYRVQSDENWSGWSTYTSGDYISTTGKSAVEIRTRRMASNCSNTDYVSVSWNIEVAPVNGTLIKIPDENYVCEGTYVSAFLNEGSGGNGIDRLEISYFVGDTWSDYTSYTEGTEINTSGLVAIHLRTWRESTECINSDTTGVVWIMEETTVAGQIEGGTTVCPGDNHTLLVNNGYVGYISLWQSSTDNWASFNNIPNHTATLIVNDLQQTTQYRALVQNGYCNLEYTAPVEIEVEVIPEPFINGEADVCENASATYNTLSGMYNYEWNLTGGVIFSGQGTNQVEVLWNDYGSQQISVTYETSSGCALPEPFELAVYITPAPEKPVITVDWVELILTSSAITGNQWYLNGNEISGGTENVWQVTENGDYNVVVTNEEGCSSEISETVTITNVNTGSDIELTLKIYPNPTQGVLNIELTSKDMADYELNVIDGMGRQIVFEDLGIVSQFNKVINLKDYQSGLYTVLIRHDDKVMMKKVVLINNK